MLDEPFRMLPHSKHGFYCHSALPDDLGIQYQSYAQTEVVAEDECITLWPGLGHTGGCYGLVQSSCDLSTPLFRAVTIITVIHLYMFIYM